MLLLMKKTVSKAVFIGVRYFLYAQLLRRNSTVPKALGSCYSLEKRKNGDERVRVDRKFREFAE